MEILEMETGSIFVEMLVGIQGWFGCDRSAATINSELFPLKTEAQAIRYGHVRQVFRLSDSTSTFPALTFYAAFPVGSLLLVNFCCDIALPVLSQITQLAQKLSQDQPRMSRSS